MTFKLLFSEESMSQLKGLDNKTAARILNRIEAAIDNPTHFFERLSGREEYKMRVGDYRVIARLFIGENEIFILSIGHRKNIYKK